MPVLADYTCFEDTSFSLSKWVKHIFSLYFFFNTFIKVKSTFTEGYFQQNGKSIDSLLRLLDFWSRKKSMAASKNALTWSALNHTLKLAPVHTPYTINHCLMISIKTCWCMCQKMQMVHQNFAYGLCSVTWTNLSKYETGTGL